MTGERFYPPRSFAAVPAQYAAYDQARVVVLPVPYESTATGWPGTRDGPAAIIEASENMELYDIDLGGEPYRAGIHTLPEVAPHSGGPRAMIDRIEEIVGQLIDEGKLVVTLGGEHTVAVGAVRAYARRLARLSVLALDANADLRDSYLDSPYNHACTLRRILEERPVVQVGLRSVSREEQEFIGQEGLPFYSPSDFRRLGPEEIASRLSETVYISIDLDAFDPSQMAAVGTPEPGGLMWDEVCQLLATVARQRRIVGFDVTELAPQLGPKANAQLAARLTYRLIGLALRE